MSAKHWQDKEWAMDRGERYGNQRDQKAEEKRKDRQRERAQEKRGWSKETRQYA